MKTLEGKVALISGAARGQGAVDDEHCPRVGDRLAAGFEGRARGWQDEVKMPVRRDAALQDPLPILELARGQRGLEDVHATPQDDGGVGAVGARD